MNDLFANTGKSRHLASGTILQFMKKYVILASIMLVMLVVMDGCKSKEKMARLKAEQEYAEKVQKAKAELLAILNDNGTMPLSEKERRLIAIREMNLNDAEVLDLIAKVEAKISAEKAAIQRAEEEARKLKELEESKKKETNKLDYLTEYFTGIANAKNFGVANEKIDETMKLFASENTPVLIIVSQADGITDYDKPTTIKKFLNYVKDQKKYNYNIQNVVTDDYNLITELELIIR